MPTKKRSSDSKNPTIGQLNASGPFKPLKEKLMLFGQFVGDWDIVEARSLQEDGTWITSKGEFHSGWILGGTAIQDVWKSNDHGVVDTGGTTIHVYDADTDGWNSIWISPNQATIRGFTGRKKGTEIELESKETNRKIMKWVFFDVRKGSFKWRSESTNDSGKNWVLTEEMFVKRHIQKSR
ncbi:MAG: hypothetical protein QXU18_04770 [Thermoplasmatales archaeon]